jgi:RNA polymerase sigma-70 factor (ECF subfamily)
LTSLGDGELTARVAAGDPAAFDRLWARYREPLYRVVAAMAADRADAEDIVQWTWLRALTALRDGRYQHRDQFLAWLCRIARNVLIDTCVRPRTGQMLPLDEGAAAATASGASPESATILRLLLEFLNRQLDESLGCAEGARGRGKEGHIKKLAFLLYYRDGYTRDEVTEVIGREYARHGMSPPSPAAVNNWLAGGRLLRRLVDHLVKEHTDSLEKLSVLVPADAGLTEQEAAAWVMVARARRAPGAGEELDPETIALAASAEKKIVDLLTREIAKALHDMRSRSP